MKVTCDFCYCTDQGNVDQLIKMGWNRVVISAPIRETITACRFHTAAFNEKIIEVLNEARNKK